MLVATIMLFGCGKGSDTDLVKNGIMSFNQTTTVGKALDNWKSCEKRSWEEFHTDSGIRVVQFTCQHKIAPFIERIKTLLEGKTSGKGEHLELLSNVQTFQFTINQDDSFQIDNVQVKNTWVDGTSFEDSQVPLEQLETAYANKFNFDPVSLSTGAAAQYSQLFRMIKP